jgi:DNA-binding NarL/FixJ family response regulator
MTRILIADDHDGTRAVLRVLLQRHAGWKICGEASTGSEALQKTIELKPDVLVKDWVMPGMDSLELTSQISKLSPDTAVVIFSFHDLPKLESLAKAAGVQAVATKDLSSLITAIEGVEHHSANRLFAKRLATKPTLANTGDVD